MRLTMELHHIRLIGFATGTLIVGLQTFLIARQSRKASGRERYRIVECGLFCLVTFLWQFGNLADEVAVSLNFNSGSSLFQTTYFIRRASLHLIPLSLSYLSPLFEDQSGFNVLVLRVGRWLRGGLWPWSVALIVTQTAWFLGWPANESLAGLLAHTSVRLILLFFVIFTIQTFYQI